VIEEHVTIEKNLEEILKDINKQVLETNYTLNLRQLLQVIHDIKRYILNLIPSKPIVQESVVASIAIDHQIVVI
jgi:hypothetical protein